MTPAQTVLVGLTVGDTADRWALLGFRPRSIPFGEVDGVGLPFDNGALICVERPSPTLVVAHAAPGHGPLPRDSDIDGVPIEWVATPDPTQRSPGVDHAVDHANGARSLDHIVLNTDSLERSSAAVERVLGLPLKRVREVGEGPGAIRQGFHRFADRGCILEIVERPAGSSTKPEAGAARQADRATVDRATVYGVVAITDRLEQLAADLGDELISSPRPAVQPGRSIATVRRAASLPLAVALMSPESRPSQQPSSAT